MGIDALIAILDVIYSHDSVREIRKKLINLNTGDSLSLSKVNEIFMGLEGNWADANPNPDDPRKVIKTICAYIKDQMFK